MALKRVPLELVQGWPELDGALMELEVDAADLIGSFGGWIRARGLSCHCLVDSCPISVCFGLSGTFGGSDKGGWSRLEVGGLGAGLFGSGRDSIRF